LCNSPCLNQFIERSGKCIREGKRSRKEVEKKGEIRAREGGRKEGRK
jgi:hypothetical protein